MKYHCIQILNQGLWKVGPCVTPVKVVMHFRIFFPRNPKAKDTFGWETHFHWSAITLS